MLNAEIVCCDLWLVRQIDSSYSNLPGEYRGVQRSREEYREVERSTEEYRGVQIQRSTVEYRGVLTICPDQAAHPVVEMSM